MLLNLEFDTNLCDDEKKGRVGDLKTNSVNDY